MSDTLTCRVESRRDAIAANQRWNGIDYLEVADDQRSLFVYFFGGRPDGIAPRNVRVEGGRRITGIVVTSVTPGPADDARGADCLRVALDRYGDFSTYTLRLVADEGEGPPPNIDPRYAQVDFSFKVDCPSDHDCAAPPACADAPRAAPDVDYLVKDYAGFRRLIFDRLATTMPDWRERHVPDLGVTLVELLAHAADQLSAYQDAVATEAYLDTARTRISVRRHARLVDYRLHEGCNARAWLTLGCDVDTELPADAYFVTAHDDIAAVANGATCRESDLAYIPPGVYEVFEQALAPAGPTPLVAAHGKIDFYTWGDAECCLRKGATRATLVDPSPAAEGGYGGEPPNRLKPGDVLIFEEVIGAETGNPADADPSHRQAVRLTRVEYARDALCDVAIVEIEWAAADALRFTLCVSARLAAPDCRRVDGISVARGNVILVDHGRWIRGEALGCVGSVAASLPCGCDGSVPESIARPAPFVPALREAPLVYAVAPPSDGPASGALEQDPRRALPRIAIDDGRFAWQPRADLLDSGGDERHVVVETDDDGRGVLRFGDGSAGRPATPGACFRADYRIGEARAGNVAREAIAYVVFRASAVGGAGLKPRNPLPALGGTAPETLAAAKLAAPRAFRSTLVRAITADDYAQLAQNDAAVQRANARLVWTGSWYEADVAIDPYGTEEASSALCERIARYLECFRRAGHDLHVRPARYVPLAVTLAICVEPGHLASHVAAAVRAVLVGRRGDGRRAFFHPDALTFGKDIQASDLVAAAHGVEGVQSVMVVELRRLGEPAANEAPSKVDLASWEIAQLDDDPNFPEHGVLALQIGGGR
ncbi:putative baseplate assembly protein [Tahibacter soli]|uniref:Baseplate assembly protein n=1 Tax=Tahibacter soli TaxID=2983605 RepID=A0A9X3YS26_9GAMM|nr:putative baseplate assembly protein [Tahibacter soli]MDC8016083.1 putative baseplate assembly protein [Tahibacter soli]